MQMKASEINGQEKGQWNPQLDRCLALDWDFTRLVTNSSSRPFNWEHVIQGQGTLLREEGGCQRVKG